MQIKPARAFPAVFSSARRMQADAEDHQVWVDGIPMCQAKRDCLNLNRQQGQATGRAGIIQFS
jgi:hypothetical protein